jgi:hypothetical protein
VYDVDEADAGQEPDGEWDDESDTTSMLASFVTMLAQLPECQKQQEDARYDE